MWKRRNISLETKLAMTPLVLNNHSKAHKQAKKTPREDRGKEHTILLKKRKRLLNKNIKNLSS